MKTGGVMLKENKKSMFTVAKLGHRDYADGLVLYLTNSADGKLIRMRISKKGRLLFKKTIKFFNIFPVVDSLLFNKDNKTFAFDGFNADAWLNKSIHFLVRDKDELTDFLNLFLSSFHALKMLMDKDKYEWVYPVDCRGGCRGLFCNSCGR